MRSVAEGLQKTLEALRTLSYWLQPSDSAAWTPFCASGKGFSAVQEEEEGRIRLGSRLGETASPSLLIKFPPTPTSQWRQQTNRTAGRWGKASPRQPPATTCPGKGATDQEGFQLPAFSLAGLQPPRPEGSAPAWGT